MLSILVLLSVSQINGLKTGLFAKVTISCWKDQLTPLYSSTGAKLYINMNNLLAFYSPKLENVFLETEELSN